MLAVLAGGEVDVPDVDLREVLALGDPFRRRLATSVAVAWADRLAADPALDAPAKFIEAVHRRARDVIEGWWGDDVEVTVEPATARADLVEDDDGALLTVGGWHGSPTCGVEGSR